MNWDKLRSLAAQDSRLGELLPSSGETISRQRRMDLADYLNARVLRGPVPTPELKALLYREDGVQRIGLLLAAPPGNDRGTWACAWMLMNGLKDLAYIDLDLAVWSGLLDRLANAEILSWDLRRVIGDLPANRLSYAELLGGSGAKVGEASLIGF